MEVWEVWLCHVGLTLAAFVLLHLVPFFHLAHVKVFSLLLDSFNIKLFAFHQKCIGKLFCVTYPNLKTSTKHLILGD